GPTTFFTPVGSDSVVFPFATTAEGTEWWSSDGTVGGTRMLLDYVPGPTSGVGTTRNVRTADGSVYFFPYLENAPPDIYRTDGTPGGTYLVRTIDQTSFAGGVGSIGDVAY